MTSFEMNSIIIRQICNKLEPGKKMLQKLMYLISRRGVNLDFNYSIHFFGPYSPKLENIIYALESYDKLRIDTSGTTHTIHLGTVEIDGVLESVDQVQVDEVLANFSTKTAYELEAITTIDYVASVLLKQHGSDQEIINKVRQIKGTKFSEEYLQNGLKILKQFKYIAQSNE